MNKKNKDKNCIKEKKEGLFLDEKPREKLILRGAIALNNIELLAIILRTGTKNKNVIELSKEIIDTYSIDIISRKSYEELLEFKGIKSAKATQIVALFELSRRLYMKTNVKKISITSSKQIYDYVRPDYLKLEHERVMAIFVNTKNNPIKKEFIHVGTINYSIIEPRDIIKRVLALYASGFFLIHNHPSGDTTPSQEDIDVTIKIKNICKSMNIRFLDHIIIADNDYYSFFDNNIF